jgi:D-alanyl-D-alanine carboxypeptidase
MAEVRDKQQEPESLPQTVPGVDLDAIRAEVAKNVAAEEVQQQKEQILREANDEAVRIVEEARQQADKSRVEAGVVPVRESETNKVDNGSVALQYLGTSDRFYVGADKDGAAVYAYAGGEPVYVTADLRDQLLALPHDQFQETGK